MTTTRAGEARRGAPPSSARAPPSMGGGGGGSWGGGVTKGRWQRTPLSDGQCTVRGSRQSGGCRRAVSPLLTLRRPPYPDTPPPLVALPPRGIVSPDGSRCSMHTTLSLPLALSLSFFLSIWLHRVAPSLLSLHHPFPVVPSPPRTRHRRGSWPIFAGEGGIRGVGAAPLVFFTLSKFKTGSWMSKEKMNASELRNNGRRSIEGEFESKLSKFKC